MKIGCIMVTEGRAPIWGIALQSFLTQEYEDAELLVDIGDSKFEEYAKYAPDGQLPMGVTCYNSNSKSTTVPWRLDVGARLLFESGCAVVTMWDDDDYSPPSRLSQLASMDWSQSVPLVASYGEGWFCNLRTLFAEHVEVMPNHLWGGCLTFNKTAWMAAGGFYDKPMPGYDRRFVEQVKHIKGFRQMVLSPSLGLPIAFSHGKNVATWLKNRGEYIGDKFSDFFMPEAVQKEVVLAKNFLIEKRQFPPQP